MLIELLTDPVVWSSLLGIGMIIGLMAYYAYLIMKNTRQGR